MAWSHDDVLQVEIKHPIPDHTTHTNELFTFKTGQIDDTSLQRSFSSVETDLAPSAVRTQLYEIFWFWWGK